MNLRDLQYLVAVADHKHFGKAAKACHVSQPTLSMQIRKLEEYLGVVLIERTQRQVLITAEGEAIIACARRVLREAEDLRKAARTMQDPLSGELRIGLFPTLAPYLLPKVVPALHRDYPQMRLLLVEEKTDELLLQLRGGKIDAAVLALPASHGEFEERHLFHDRFMLAVPTGHPLADKKSLKPADLKGNELLLLEDGHCLRDQALSVCQLAGTHESDAFRATSLETLRHMVQAGVGITLIPAIAQKADDGLSYIPFKDALIAREIGLVWRRQTTRSPAINALSAALASAGESLSPAKPPRHQRPA